MAVEADTTQTERMASPELRGMIEPLSDGLLRYAHARGYTQLRFNPKTMGWAWHKPDQAIGEDGRIYIRADCI